MGKETGICGLEETEDARKRSDKEKRNDIHLFKKKRKGKREKRMPNPLSEAGGASPGYQHAILIELEQ